MFNASQLPPEGKLSNVAAENIGWGHVTVPEDKLISALSRPQNPNLNKTQELGVLGAHSGTSKPYNLGPERSGRAAQLQHHAISHGSSRCRHLGGSGEKGNDGPGARRSQVRALNAQQHDSNNVLCFHHMFFTLFLKQRLGLPLLQGSKYNPDGSINPLFTEATDLSYLMPGQRCSIFGSLPETETQLDEDALPDAANQGSTAGASDMNDWVRETLFAAGLKPISQLNLEAFEPKEDGSIPEGTLAPDIFDPVPSPLLAVLQLLALSMEEDQRQEAAAAQQGGAHDGRA